MRKLFLLAMISIVAIWIMAHVEPSWKSTPESPSGPVWTGDSCGSRGPCQTGRGYYCLPKACGSGRIKIPEQKIQFVKVASGIFNDRIAPLQVVQVEVMPARIPGFAEVGPVQTWWGTSSDEYWVKLSPQFFDCSIIIGTHIMMHEFAHVLYNADPSVRATADEFFAAMTGQEKFFFKDSAFYSNSCTDAGHPWDNASELFASTYALACMAELGKLSYQVVPRTQNERLWWQYVSSLKPIGLGRVPAAW
jgi:hypothetical protein